MSKYIHSRKLDQTIQYLLSRVSGGTYSALDDGSTTTWDFTFRERFKYWVIEGDNTLAISGTKDGDFGVLLLIQDGIGGRTPVIPGNLPEGKSLSTGANEVDLLTFTNYGGILFWDIINYGAISFGSTTTTTTTTTTSSTTTTTTTSAGFDSDAVSYFTTSGISDNTTKNAVNDLILGYKSGGYWTPAFYLNPFAGPDLTAQSKQAKNPATYAGTFSGSPVYNANGFTPDGVNDTMDRGMQFGTAITDINAQTHIIYVGNNFSGGDKAAFGIYSTASYAQIYFFPRLANNKVQATCGDATAFTSSYLNTSPKGVYVITRNGSVGFKIYKDGVEIVDATADSTGKLPLDGTNTDRVGAFNSHVSNSPTSFSDIQIGFLSHLNVGLNPTQVVEITTTVQNYITAMGR